jgi:phage tail sheath protein FI
MKTPGVYIVEKSAFPNSVVEVETAVPAFIGYTEKADNMGKSLSNAPWKITSMADFHKYFGGAPEPMFSIGKVGNPAADAAKPDEKKKKVTEKDEKAKAKAGQATEPKTGASGAEFSFGGDTFLVAQTAGRFLLYNCMRLFFQNGGGPCYIVSVGSYQDSIEMEAMRKALDLLIKEQEPTMVVIPDAMLLDQANCTSLQQAVLAHCGGTMKNRVAVLDIWNGYLDRQLPSGDCIAQFRNSLGINYLDYAVAYYPWVNTTIVQDNELSFKNIVNLDDLKAYLMAELGIDVKALAVKDTDTPAEKSQKDKKAQQKETLDAITVKREEGEPETGMLMLNKSLVAMSPLFNTILLEIKNQLNLLPPGAAMAGIYTMVDNTRGVWKAPANVSLNAVVAPTVNITHYEQEDLNVTPMGKSINAIRTFIGEGTLVWGARTLDGNSLDWRYINVRRTLIMLEESIKLAAKAYVFEDNVGTTWVTIKSMINNFLTGIWKRGGLAGASAQDAFSVFVGLGETMTPEDILEGILRVTVLVAPVRPAEFIEITFQQQMQKS